MRILAIPLVTIAGAWDAIDGSVARAQGKDSMYGEYIEGIIDKWVEIIIYAGLFLAGYQLESFILFASSTMLSLVKPRLSLIVPSDNHDWPGFGDRADRLTLLVLALILNSFVRSFTVFGVTIDTLSTSLYLIAGLAFLGHLQRTRYGVGLLQEHIQQQAPGQTSGQDPS
jgi:archaetidylinositol phosphate synthase